MQLHRIDLNDVVLFEKEEIPIDENGGLVIIQGLNHDSDEPDNTNGAGKSLAFSALANLRYESTPLSNKKRSKKEVLLGKKSCIAIEYTGADNSRYRFEQYPGSYAMYIDGSDQNIAKQEVAKKYLETTFPMSEHEFYSTCFIQNLKPLYFQVETDSNRLKFITDVFDLDIYDKIRKYMNAKKGEIKDKEIEYTTLAGQLDTCLVQIKKLDWKDGDDERASELKGKIKTLKSKLSKLYKKQQRIESLLEDLEDLRTLESKAAKLEGVLPKKKNLGTFLETQASLHSAYDKYLDKKENYDSLSKTIRARIEVLKESIGDREIVTVKSLKKKFEALDEKLEVAETKLRKAKRNNAIRLEIVESLDEYKDKLKALGYSSPKKVPKPDDGVDLSLARRTIAMAENLEHHEHAGGDSCPTCGGDIDTDAIMELADKARAQIKKHKKLEQAISVVKEIKDLNRMLKDHGDEIDTSKLSEKVDSLQAELDSIEQFARLIKDWEHQHEMLDQLTKPKKPKKLPDSKYDSEQIDSLVDSHDRWLRAKKDLAKVQKRFDGVDVDDLSGESESLTSEIESLNDKLDSLQDKFSSIKVRKGEFGLLSKQKRQMKKRLKQIEPIIKQKKLVEYLYKMYGATEFKLQAASQILNILQNSLNQYSSLVFPEKIQFKLEPSSSGVSAQYKTSKNGIWADIRHMSGAERNCFRLLFAVALLPLIPEERRTNFIILDEPDAACSKAVRRRIIEDFIPKLRQIVPHVFWITPKEPYGFKEAEVWTVEKKNGASKIIRP